MSLYFFVMLFLMVMSLFFLTLVLIMKEFYILFTLYMLVSYMVLRYIYYNKTNEYQGIPIYIYLFMPGLGSILLIFIFFPLYYFKRSSFLIEDYETYINFKNQLDREKSFDYEESIKILSGLDLMNHLSPRAKKQLIIEKINKVSGNKIRILKSANLDKDTEVQHYAAVMLNEIENNFNNKIYELQEEYKEKSSLKILDQLIRAYKKYIESSLLEENALSTYNDEYIRLLNIRKEKSKLEKHHIIELMDAYIRKMDFIKSREIFEIGIKIYPKTLELYLLKLKLDLKLNNHEAIRKDIQALETFDLLAIDSSHYKSQVEFWCQKPIERKI